MRTRGLAGDGSFLRNLSDATEACCETHLALRNDAPEAPWTDSGGKVANGVRGGQSRHGAAFE